MARAKKVKWIEGDRVEITPPKSTKKITGTRLASVLGFNPYSSPFQAWCEVTRTYELPFEGNVFTEAGSAIEPKVQEYLKDIYFDDLVTPEELYGANPFKATFGNFFDHKYLGGMWDAIVPESEIVVEIKTTSKPEGWIESAPVYQALQGALYAYLKGWKTVAMVGVFLSPPHYDDPHSFVPDASNVKVDMFNIYERFPNWNEWMDRVERYYYDNVLEGISPVYDEKTDKEFLKALRTISPTPDGVSAASLGEIEKILLELKTLEEKTKPLKKRLEELETGIKTQLTTELESNPNAEYAELGVEGGRVVYTLARGSRKSYDEEKMKIDGVDTDYIIYKETLTLRKKLMEENNNG